MGTRLSRPQSSQHSNQYSDQRPLVRHGMRNRPLPPIPTEVTPPSSPIMRPPSQPVTLQLQGLREEYNEACRRHDFKAMGELSVKIERQRLQDDRDWKFARLQAEGGTFAPGRR